METSGNLLVFVILGVAFAGVGIHLLLWTRRRARQLRRFAEARGFGYRSRDDGRLERDLNALVAIDEPGMGRAFGRVRDLVSVGDATLFRATEAVDLVPWGEPQNSHHARTGIVFPAGLDSEGVFGLLPDGRIDQRYPRGDACVPGLRSTLERAGVASPPCPLSLTVGRGRAVACLEPMVAGALESRYLDYLLELAARLGGQRTRD